jgi:hypothetical protein
MPICGGIAKSLRMLTAPIHRFGGEHRGRIGVRFSDNKDRDLRATTAVASGDKHPVAP